MGSAKLIGENENVIRIMSIHKSKGLEFPIVFLCGTGKKFNLQDLNRTILLHQDMGFGPKLIDVDKKIQYNTLAKEAIHIKSKKETISEEMRVLYVALTRAKEKLMITGITKDLQKSLQEKEQMLAMYKNAEGKINPLLVEKYISYLDWLELVYLYNKDKIENIVSLKEYKKNDIICHKSKEEKTEKTIQEWIEEYEETEETKQLRQQIKAVLEWQYPYEGSAKIPTKTSVTKLKQLEEQEMILDIEDLMAEKEEKVETQKTKSLMQMPKFMEKEQKLTPTQKGTLMHLCVQKLDETKEYSRDEIKQFVQDLYEKEIITQIEKQSVDIQALYDYTKSWLWQDLKQAKEIHKEQPFYIHIPAKDIYENAEETEKILVQGIIDLYYIDKDDQLILIDFKTDHIKKGEEKQLEEKYKKQLDLYKQALEGSLGKHVNKATIYSLA